MKVVNTLCLEQNTKDKLIESFVYICREKIWKIGKLCFFYKMKQSPPSNRKTDPLKYEKKSNEGYSTAETRSVDWDHSCIMPSRFALSYTLMNMGFWNIVAGTTFPRQYHRQANQSARESKFVENSLWHSPKKG